MLRWEAVAAAAAATAAGVAATTASPESSIADAMTERRSGLRAAASSSQAATRRLCRGQPGREAPGRRPRQQDNGGGRRARGAGTARGQVESKQEMGGWLALMFSRLARVVQSSGTVLWATLLLPCLQDKAQGREEYMGYINGGAWDFVQARPGEGAGGRCLGGPGPIRKGTRKRGTYC